ncbi:hypothetical protein [Spectribacter hydrogenoxidans]|uniref:Uncharacterized protein n=1 Tax=Spectribacter hydrogenoxidans TaxID=3075608 RepID=A0ABU3BXZ5_9GAMM|nr:hypothetical protein [Salinisphaera sp. W335]MDT0633996.1 hypothetical protein [Salinisphaera sp. W335]
MADNEGSILMGMIWMAVISLLLFWLPLLGPLLAGIVGGRTAGGVGAGLLAAVLPALALSGLLFLMGTALTGLPVIGLIAGAGVFVLIAFQMVPLLIGAFIGGLLT